ncbi:MULTISPECIES: VOC family protein [unclassified Pseudomonas]|uniref:VOC family protein n=1 Tax=unclassified Pseudomonas TaxID=196821 RepID=UPI000CD2A8FA|nr:MULTISPECIES: VOC family protein [unclassified Pseudomonas]POA30964.1 VOC family protein [Pseudomonas sp. GW456-R21]POA67992.1 VOC family protein [Pseudomonas sp. GW460-R15]
MKINPYLIFNGDCKAAFTFYAQCLQGTLEMMMTFGESPARDQIPASSHDLIMHTRLVVGDQVLMASDTTPDRPYHGISGCSVSLNVTSIAEAERIFSALADKGTIQMPLEATFWAARFGMLVDRFGVPWMVNCEADK